MLKKFTLVQIVLLSSFAFADDGLSYVNTINKAENTIAVNEYTLKNNQKYENISPINADGTINVVVEIPTGTLAKWEMSKENADELIWEFKKGKPRIVNYLGYPGNYGAIAGTSLPIELGGDGDPLDVLVIGQAVPRGEVVSVRLIGVLKALDDGEQDDKLIAVMTKASPFSKIKTLKALDEEFNGVSEIIKIWFSNYKGRDGDMKILGYEDEKVAMDVLEQSIANFKK